MSNTSQSGDFEVFWQKVCHQLESVSIAPEEEIIPIRSTEFCDCYTVKFTGIGPYRLFGYLSIPHGQGPFPTLLLGPGYHSVVEPLPQGDANEKRKRFLIFSVAGRRQRNADKPFAAIYPGLMTKGIDDPDTYIFRGIVADWLRAVDYLLTRPEVDLSKLGAIQKDDLPLLISALRPEVTHLVATPKYFYPSHNQQPEEVTDYLRLFPEKRTLVERTLSFFNLISFAPSVQAKTLLWGDSKELKPLISALEGETEIRMSERSSYKDGLFQERWISNQFGFSDSIIPWHWQ